MDPWIYGFAAGAAVRAAAGAVGAAASAAAAVCTHYVILGGARSALVYVHNVNQVMVRP